MPVPVHPPARGAARQAAVIRHLHFEDLGSFHAVLAAHGYAITYYDAGMPGPALPQALAPDLLVVLGGPIGAYEEASYPYLSATVAMLAARAAADAPTLGVCLGAQLLARALGAPVYPGQGKEIGWAPLSLTAAGLASPLRHLDGAHTSMLHWHGDTFDLPAGAVLLASTARYANQVFSYGRHLLAFQCHPELEAASFERWLIGHAGEIAATPGLTVAGLRAATREHGAALESAAQRMLDEWLDALAGSATCRLAGPTRHAASA